jgi:hypothetical protein
MISFVFCCTATTIVSGSMAERTFNDTYFFSSVLMAGIVYPIGAGWVWGGGWLSEMGFLDHAGSGVVPWWAVQQDGWRPTFVVQDLDDSRTKLMTNSKSADEKSNKC